MAFPVGYGGYGGGYGAFGGYGGGYGMGMGGGLPYPGQYDPYANGIGLQGVRTGAYTTPNLALPDQLKGELNRDSQEKKGGYIGAGTGAAAGAAIGAGIGACFANPITIGIGAAVGGFGGLLLGMFSGDKIGKINATMTDVEKDGKMDGNSIGDGSQVF